MFPTTFVVNDNVESPEFLEFPESMEVTEGKDVTFVCKVKAKPMVEIIWNRDGTPLEKDKHINIKDKQNKSELSTSSELTIKTVSTDLHEGAYDVEARNEFGNIMHLVELIGEYYLGGD